MAPCCSYELLTAAVDTARRMNQSLAVGSIFTSDCFYDELQNQKALSNMGVLAVEMETAALYLTAARFGKQALALLTITDDPATGEGLTAAERQDTLSAMISIALEIA